MYQIKEGRYLRVTGLGAAAVVAIAGAVLNGSCLWDTTTTLCEATGVRCRPGQVCSGDQKTCVAIGGCGDGVINVEKGEVCDDGNTLDGDGCSHDCKSDETCGNRIKDVAVGETCDDGDIKPDDGCSATCQLETCGDGFYNPGEECDTAGDTRACNGSGLCTVPQCGDGYANTKFTPFRAIATEQCDEGDPITKTVVDSANCNGNNNGDFGPGSCRYPLCGDGYLNTSFKPEGASDGVTEKCDMGGDTSMCNGDGNGDSKNIADSKCQPARCGDHYLNMKSKPEGSNLTEGCDEGGGTPTCNGDGNGDDQNIADSKCQSAKCGDGYLNMKYKPVGSSLTEGCDTGGDTSTCNGDGNGDSNNNADSKCQVASCGDGYTNKQRNPPEQCDKGTVNNSNSMPNGCRTDCRKAFCGDGVLDNGEECDPGGAYGNPPKTENCKAPKASCVSVDDPMNNIRKCICF